MKKACLAIKFLYERAKRSGEGHKKYANRPCKTICTYGIVKTIAHTYNFC